MLNKANDYIGKNHIPKEERPTFHLSPPIGWMNDPNGFSVYDHQVHLFYQFNPYDSMWGTMHWGHATSDDMIRWEDKTVVLAPDQTYDNHGCFSGSAITVDGHHILAYTGVTRNDEGKILQNQCLAVGDGQTYHKIPENPIITGDMLPRGFSLSEFRDPKIWKEGDTYYMLVGNRDSSSQGQLVIFSSSNLVNWDYKGVFVKNDSLGDMLECPDFFEMSGEHILICSPQNVAAKGLDFHNGHNAVYYTGDFDRETLHFNQKDVSTLDYGLDFYAPQTVLLTDGRRVMIAWMQSWDSYQTSKHLKWQGMMTLPREISLVNGLLTQTPIRELGNYHVNKVSYHQQDISQKHCFKGISGRSIDLMIDITLVESFTFELAQNSDYCTRLIYSKDDHTLEIDRTYSGITKDINCQRKMPIKGARDNLSLRCVMDKGSIELFVNGGQQTMTTVIYTPLEADNISFYSEKPCIVNLVKFDIVVK